MRLLLILLPWLELFTLIQLGIETSAITALLYVLVTFVVGLWVLRRQGAGMLTRLREQQAGGVLGPQLLLDDMVVGVSGILLMIPGMLSDVAALLVLIGPLRRKALHWLGGSPPEPYAPQRDTTAHETIEGSYRRLDE